MLGYENGKLQKVDTAGSWVLSLLLAAILLIPVWFVWQIIKYFFNLIFGTTDNKNSNVEKGQEWRY
tara:strand:+ start:377 stop:574 length:198 start_codon:yes stop_codon:yes gene_type:complete